MNTRIKYWISGVAVAVAGLILARVVSGMYAGQPVVQIVLYIAGVTLAMAGLLIIMIGIRKAR
ncbi:MAG: hypothetical protein JXA46_09405 [Dehalococcoidales bacterium]|nr:hypothetical protein [Dehalococcoidales bacterium]